MLSPERLQGHRAAIIATALAGAEILGGQGAIAQSPTPQPETQSASVTKTQILGETSYSWVYKAPWLFFPSIQACIMDGPAPEPTPNTIPTADISTTALGLENPKPSLVLAKQTMTDGSTIICTLAEQPSQQRPDKISYSPKEMIDDAINRNKTDNITVAELKDDVRAVYKSAPDLVSDTPLEVELKNVDACATGGDPREKRKAQIIKNRLGICESSASYWYSTILPLSNGNLDVYILARDYVRFGNQELGGKFLGQIKKVFKVK